MTTISFHVFAALLFLCAAMVLPVSAAEDNAPAENAGEPARPVLHIGWAQIDITPKQQVNMVGQNHLRITTPEEAHDPLTATALVLQAGDEHAVLVSLDLVGAYDIGVMLQERMADTDTDGLDLSRMMMFATHTHTGPHLGTKEGYPEGTMQGPEYREDLYQQLESIILEAWRSRKPGSIGWSQCELPIGFNRIAVYRDGTAKMYGTTKTPTFKGLQGPNDQLVTLMYTWDEAGALTGVVANVACPSQVLEHTRRLSADFWHEARVAMRAREALGSGLFVLPMCGAAGDQSPNDLQHPILSKDQQRSHERARQIGAMLADAVEGGLAMAEDTREDAPRLAMARRQFTLPRKLGRTRTHPFPVDMHALRIGAGAVTESQFELYTAYGLDIRRRSPARYTMHAQLASGPEYGMYLATEDAIPGKAYGARLKNGQVPPAGGAILVEWTLDALAELFP